MGPERANKLVLTVLFVVQETRKSKQAYNYYAFCSFGPPGRALGPQGGDRPRIDPLERPICKALGPGGAVQKWTGAAATAV